MHIIDKQKFIDAFLSEGSYKHLNTLILVVASKLDHEVAAVIEDWMNEPVNLRWLAFIENMTHPEKWSETSENAFQQFMLDIEQGKRITVEDWQHKTQGLSILCANNQFFASTYLAVVMCSSLNKEVWSLLQPAVSDLLRKYAYEMQLFQNFFPGQKNIDMLAFLCILSFDSIRWFYEMFLGEERTLVRKSEYMQKCIFLAKKYLKL